MIAVMKDSVTISSSRLLQYNDYKHEDFLDVDWIYDKLKDLKWEKIYGSSGKLLRHGCWYTNGGCTCPYAYSNQHHQANPFEDWMIEVAHKLDELLGVFNDNFIGSVNFSRYDNDQSSVYFHADDEELFQSSLGSATIVSMSFGASRYFSVKSNFQRDEDAKHIKLDHGDILTMEGRMQQFYQHAVLPSNKIKGAVALAAQEGPRFNATWRVIHKHLPKCPLKIEGN